MEDRTEIEYIINQMLSRRVVFLPNKADLLQKVFYKNCVYLESLGACPISNIDSLKICIKADLLKLLERADDVYYEYAQTIYMKSKYILN